MLAQWLSEGKVSNMVDDTRIVALHVLCAAGFGVQHDFKGGARVSAPGHKLSHRDALMVILNNFIATMVIVPQKQFFHHVAKLLSPHMNRVLLAVNEFRQYTEEAIALERRLLAEHSGAERHNLMSTLIRTSDQAKAHNVQCANILTDDEIKGNIFIFNVAGHDTTANTLAYAFALLAINPEIQQWVIEEIDEALQGEEVSKYEHAYPLLNRIIAVMVSFPKFSVLSTMHHQRSGQSLYLCFMLQIAYPRCRLGMANTMGRNSALNKPLSSSMAD